LNGYQYILSRQYEWARNRNISLVGSKGERGRPLYTAKLEDNLFQPLLPDVRASFAAGDGGELGSSTFPGKMQALHSSSACAVDKTHPRFETPGWPERFPAALFVVRRTW
jgi:hypothetical protein